MARNIVRFNPLAELDALQQQLFGDDFITQFRGVNLPTTDVYMQDDNHMAVEAHLPNFDENDISVNVGDGVLIVQAEKHERSEDKGKKYMVRESSSSFYRRIALPDRADASQIDAKFKNGVLTVTVRLEALPKPSKVKINAGKSSGSQASVEGSQGDESKTDDAKKPRARNKKKTAAK